MPYQGWIAFPAVVLQYNFHNNVAELDLAGGQPRLLKKPEVQQGYAQVQY